MIFSQRAGLRLCLIAVAGSTALLAACGGSNPTEQEVFASKVTPAFASLGTATGLTSTSVVDLFDVKFLDGGTTKSDVKASLDGSAAALADAPDASLFPLATISDIAITNCDSNNVCTLNGTLSNADADRTDVTFTTKVKLANGTYLFLGDQSAS